MLVAAPDFEFGLVEQRLKLRRPIPSLLPLLLCVLPQGCGPRFELSLVLHFVLLFPSVSLVMLHLVLCH